MMEILKFSVALQFLAWVSFYVVFACVAVGLTHIIAPTAIGKLTQINTDIIDIINKLFMCLL